MIRNSVEKIATICRSTEFHSPIMLSEVLTALTDRFKAGTFLDLTLGGGGHAEALLELNNEINVIGVDLDLDAIKFASNRLKKYIGTRLHVFHSNYSLFPQLLQSCGISTHNSINGILIDLGVSSHQINSAPRGFSYLNDGPLDMRMNASDKSHTAQHVINGYSQDALIRVLEEFGDFRSSSSYKMSSENLCQSIVNHRPIRTTHELVDALSTNLPKSYPYRFQILSRIFQAVRIEVNSELKHLSIALDHAWSALSPRGGRLVVLSYQSLEDDIIKSKVRRWKGIGMANSNSVCKDYALIQPSAAELKENSRCTAAKLRIIEKL